MKKNFKENEELDIIVLIEKIKLMLLSLFLQIFRRSKSFLLGWKKLLVIIIAGLVLGQILTSSLMKSISQLGCFQSLDRERAVQNIQQTSLVSVENWISNTQNTLGSDIYLGFSENLSWNKNKFIVFEPSDCALKRESFLRNTVARRHFPEH